MSLTKMVNLYEVEISELISFGGKDRINPIKDFSKIDTKEYFISGKTETGEEVRDRVRFLREIILSTKSNIAYNICQISKKDLATRNRYVVQSVISDTGDVNVKFDRIKNVKILTRMLTFPLNYSLAVYNKTTHKQETIRLYNKDKLFSYNFMDGEVLLNFQRRDSIVIDVDGWEI